MKDLKISDSLTSMRHLIAVAQAKRKQVHSQSFSHATFDATFISFTEVQGKTPSPMSQPDLPPPMSLASPSFAHGPQVAQQSQLENTEDIEERRVSSGHRTAGVPLSGGTEAAVARDAFEGMIETLSRTKESIGRATRLAIDCAKYGIANEVGIVGHMTWLFSFFLFSSSF